MLLVLVMICRLKMGLADARTRKGRAARRLGNISVNKVVIGVGGEDLSVVTEWKGDVLDDEVDGARWKRDEGWPESKNSRVSYISWVGRVSPHDSSSVMLAKGVSSPLLHRF